MGALYLSYVLYVCHVEIFSLREALIGVFIGRVDGSAKCAGISIIVTLFWCGCYIDQVLCNLLKDTHVSALEISRSENVGRSLNECHSIIYRQLTFSGEISSCSSGSPAI